jgi:flavin reductase (DIM6/NTAB) family NADH-FMN oxidoreductase RutF
MSPAAVEVESERESPMPVDARVMRSVLGRFTTGVTVVAAAVGDEIHAMTANAFTSVSLEPPLVLVSIDRRARMHELLPDSGGYGISVLAHDQQDVALHFAGRPHTLPDDLFERSPEGRPLVRGAIARIGCRLHDAYPAGDHTLYLGLVESMRSERGRPLVFAQGEFTQLVPAQVQDHQAW